MWHALYRAISARISDWRALRPGDGRAHFTHGASLLHLHTSGQMRETYDFGTCRSIPSNLYKISLPLSSTGNTTEQSRAAAFVWRERFLKGLAFFFREKTVVQREESGSRLCVWVCVSVCLSWAFCDKACEATSPSVSTQSPSSTSLSAELQLSPRVPPRLLAPAR